MNIEDIKNRQDTEHLRAKIRELENANRKMQADRGARRETIRLITEAVQAMEPLPRIPNVISSDKKSKSVTAVLKFSDWHIGEVIRASETEGFGRYDWDTAQMNVQKIVIGFLHWVNTLRGGYRIDECAVFCEGDYISGDIHRELSVTNEFPVPVQTARAGSLLGNSIATLAANFERVTVYEVGADNHGRLTMKPQFKEKAQNSYSFLVHVIANAMLEKHENVRIVTSEGIKYLATVNGYRFLIEHGDTIKSWQGVPYYGLERSKAREATRRMNNSLGFHYQSIGHFHVPALISGNIIVNGSLSGTSEFDHGCGRYALPCQVAFLVHPSHGMFNMTWFGV